MKRGRLASVAWNATLPMAAALVLGIGVLLLLWLTARAVALLLVAIAIAEALEPIVSWLPRHRIPRIAAIVLVWLVLFTIAGLIAWLIVPTFVTQGQNLVNAAPALLTKVHVWLTNVGAVTGGRAADMLASWASGLSGRLLGLPLVLLSWMIDLALVVFMSIYWLVGTSSIKGFAVSLLPANRRDRAERVLRNMGRSMGGYVRGVAISAAIMGVLSWLGLTLIGVQFALVLAVITMLGEFVPNLGPILAAVPVFGAALLESWTKALLALLLYTGLAQFEAHILSPNVMESQTDVPQVLVIFAIAAGGAFGGLLGVLAAIPLAAALRVLVLEVVAPAERRGVGADAGAEATERDQTSPAAP